MDLKENILEKVKKKEFFFSLFFKAYIYYIIYSVKNREAITPLYRKSNKIFVKTIDKSFYLQYTI